MKESKIAVEVKHSHLDHMSLSNAVIRIMQSVESVDPKPYSLPRSTLCCQQH